VIAAFLGQHLREKKRALQAALSAVAAQRTASGQASSTRAEHQNVGDPEWRAERSMAVRWLTYAGILGSEKQRNNHGEGDYAIWAAKGEKPSYVVTAHGDRKPTMGIRQHEDDCTAAPTWTTESGSGKAQ